MAALNGVKILDMVGGEITKIEYNGAEYVRVDGNAEIGDLIQIAKSGIDIEVGDIFKVEGLDEDRDAKIFDNADDFRGVNNHHHILFRKVSAETTPTVDERVDALEKRVDALEEKPATLKAGDFVTIDTSKASSGPRFTLSSHFTSIGLTDGKAYEVKEDGDGDFYLIDDDGDKRYNPLTSGAHTIVEAPKPTFKEGDIVVITANTNSSRNAVGDIGKVGKTTSYDATVDVPGKTEGLGNWTLLEEMRHATQAERQAYEESLKPALKTGDYVKFAKGGLDYTADKAYKILADEDGDLYFLDDAGDEHASALSTEYEIVKSTPFVRAGRKEGEFKAGDVVRVTGSNSGHKIGTIGVVEYGNSWPHPLVRANGVLKSHLGQMELIVPVESRVDGSEHPCA